MRTRLVALTVVAWLLFTGSASHAVAPPAFFKPDYIAIEETSYTTSQRATARLAQGTKVQATRVEGKSIDFRTDDGRSGRAKLASFQRLNSSIVVTPAATKSAAASNAFAFDLYQQTRKSPGNLFFSPASISTALAMTYAGAAGDTQREIASVLHLAPRSNPHEGFVSLLTLLNSSGDEAGYTLSTANRLWGAKGHSFNRDYLTLTREKYLAELTPLDFQQPEAARHTINAWVEEQTRKRIVDLIPPGAVNQDTRLILTNAIYFKGGWQEAFSVDHTRAAPFTLANGGKADVQLMQLLGEFPYTADADAQVLWLPYRGHELSMIVALPHKTDGLSKIEDKLTADDFNKWIAGMRANTLAEVYLPKFKMVSQLDLGATLKTLGMPTAFDRQKAEFSGISSTERLCISDVVHKAFIDVDEKGSEAAAATAVLLAPAAAPGEPSEPAKPIVFRADHPFLFFIRDNRTGAVLFMGRFEKPA